MKKAPEKGAFCSGCMPFIIARYGCQFYYIDVKQSGNLMADGTKLKRELLKSSVSIGSDQKKLPDPLL